MKAMQLEILNAQTHRELRFNSWRGARPHFIQVVPAEFAAAAATCPVFIVKNAETGEFFTGAMFGFKAGEDLLTDAKGETDALQPLDLERQGFYISGDEIAIDPSNPCFSLTSGEPLFEDDGLPANQLRHIQRVLSRLKTGVEEMNTFLAVMLRHKLIEPIDVSLKFDDGENLTLDGLYTVSLDAMQNLDDVAALEMFRQGYLQLGYCIAGSLRQVPVLARQRNRRLSA